MSMSEAQEQNHQPPNGEGAGRVPTGSVSPVGALPTRSFHGLVLGPGEQIGPFRIERELGRGGAGVVYLAHDTKLDRSVAIKSLPVELLENPQARTRFAREARVLASLNHPNIAAIYEELQEAEGVGYLVLEYVPGPMKKQAVCVSCATLAVPPGVGRSLVASLCSADRDPRAYNCAETAAGCGRLPTADTQVFRRGTD
jgi:serine/threonine protein kinase